MCRQIIAKEVTEEYNMARDKLLVKVPGFSDRTVLKRPSCKTSVLKRPASKKAKMDEDMAEQPEEEEAEAEASIAEAQESQEEEEAEAEEPGAETEESKVEHSSPEASAPSCGPDNWKQIATNDMSELPASVNF